MQTHRIRRVPILDGEGEPVGVVTIGDLARHATGMRKTDRLSADLVARTLAAVSRPSAPGIAFHVESLDGGWVVVDREGRHLGELQRTQSDAVIHAKELARRIGSAQVIVHRQDGSVASEFFYQRDERSALSSDDSLATVAASKPARARAAHRPLR
jgi:CBS domain-containing protein